MATQYDKKHRVMELQPGDAVYLNFAKKGQKGYQPAESTGKLGPLRQGPYTVLERVGNNAVRLELPKEAKMWPVVSVRNLTKAPITEDPFQRPEPQKAKAFVPREESHGIEMIIDRRLTKRNGIEYLVKWSDIELEEWINRDRLEGSRHLVEEFENSRKTTGKRRREGAEQDGPPQKK
jgi:hypothetical protein